MTPRPTPALIVGSLVALALMLAPAQRAVAGTSHASALQVIWSYDTEG